MLYLFYLGLFVHTGFTKNIYITSAFYIYI